MIQTISYRRAWILAVVMFLPSFVITSCCKTDDNEPDRTGRLKLAFAHYINGDQIIYDTLVYHNAAGNPYLVSEIQYFISDIVLYGQNGSIITIEDSGGIFYVDTDIPETRTREIPDKIPAGNYDSVSFTFGISAQKNISGRFVNPPESYMFWPENLGGGYHYMKLNGKWLEPGQTSVTTPFNCHMGIGQIYYSYPDSIIGFVHNDFRVSLPGSAFIMNEDQQKVLSLTMNVEEWFRDPYIYDFNYWGGSIMQNQEAMDQLKKNGYNVFTAIIQ
jgi:hypothetical protein